MDWYIAATIIMGLAMMITLAVQFIVALFGVRLR